MHPSVSSTVPAHYQCQTFMPNADTYCSVETAIPLAELVWLQSVVFYEDENINVPLSHHCPAHARPQPNHLDSFQHKYSFDLNNLSRHRLI